jgi:hypothetical protein
MMNALQQQPQIAAAMTAAAAAVNVIPQSLASMPGRRRHNLSLLDQLQQQLHSSSSSTGRISPG